MKKQLLTICAALASGCVLAQTPAPNWTNQHALFPANPGSLTLGAIEFMDAVDANVIWVVGSDLDSRTWNQFSRSTNGGSSWTGGYIYSVTTNPSVSDTSKFHLANMEALDANTAWVSAFYKGPGNPWVSNAQGNGAIHRTTDGGLNWINMTAPGMYTQTTAFCNWVSFLSPSVGITQGDPINLGGNNEFEIWRTTNGGMNWSIIPGASIDDPIAGEFAYVDVYAKIGTSYMWFGTNAGRIYRTVDAGLTWSATALPGSTTTDDLLEIAFSSPLHGVALMNTSSGFAMFNTTNGGASWSAVVPSGNWGWRDLCNIPGTGKIASFGYGSAYSFMSYTGDNGATWTDWGSVGIEYNYGDFVSNTTGWAGGYNIPNTSYTNVWKYTGPAITGTTIPISAFSMPLQICLGSSAETVTPANSSSATPAPTYSWSSSPAGVGFSSATATTPVITFTAPNTYSVFLTVNNGFTTQTSYQVVNVIACTQPTVAFSPANPSPCNNVAFVMNNQTTGGSPAPSYSWSASNSSITFVPNTVAMSPTIVAPVGTHTFNLLATNAAGTVLLTQTVTIKNCAPVATFQLPDTLYRCPVTSTAIIIQPTNGTTVTPAGTNTYSWSISPPAGAQPLTGPTVPNYSVKATATNVTSYNIILRVTNASGTTTLSKPVKLIWNTELCFCSPAECVGLDEVSSLPGLMVYPNPATSDIKISLPGSKGFRVTVMNILGGVVAEQNVSRENESVRIDLASKPRGVYMVTVESDGQKACTKVVLE